MDRAEFLRRGWCVFPPEPSVTDWVVATAPAALACAHDGRARTRWLRHGGTWFAGVNILENDALGRVGGGPPLSGAALDMAQEIYGPLRLDRAQISVVYPGYPRQDPGESHAAHRYRKTRDAAHVDGLVPQGPGRRRVLGEAHAWIIGLPLDGSRQAPLVVWEGSHTIMRRAFADRLAAVAPAEFGRIDLTETYHAARRTAFARCPRTRVVAAPGGAYLVHRLALHGVAPWARARPGTAPRAVAYFRPELRGGSGGMAQPALRRMGCAARSARRHGVGGQPPHTPRSIS